MARFKGVGPGSRDDVEDEAPIGAERCSGVHLANRASPLSGSITMRGSFRSMGGPYPDMAVLASPLLATASSSPVMVLSIRCEEEHSAEVAVKAPCTTWPAVDL